MSLRCQLLRKMCLLVLAIDLVTPAAHALNFVWTGEVDNRWHTINNWAPGEFGPPGTLDTATISNGQTVLIDSNFLTPDYINGLTISAGELRTNGFEAIVDNGDVGSTALTLVSGGSSRLRIDLNSSGAGSDSFDTDRLTVSSGGQANLYGGRLEVDSGLLNIGSTGRVQGYGNIDLEHIVSTPTVLLNNEGTLRVGVVDFGVLMPRTLAINVFDADGRVDLDGSSDVGEVAIGLQATLDVNGQLLGAYRGHMTFSPGSRLEMSHVWTANDFSTIDVNAESSVRTIPSQATIAGETMSHSGYLNVNSGTLFVDSDYEGYTGTINVGGQGKAATICFRGHAVVGAVNLYGTDAAPATICGDDIEFRANSFTLVDGHGVDEADFVSWQRDSHLQIDGSGSPSKFEIKGSASIAGDLEFVGDATLAADEIDMSGAVTVNDGVAIIMPEVIPQVPTARFQSSATVDVNAVTGDAKLRVEGNAEYNGTFNLNGGGGAAILNGDIIELTSGATVTIDGLGVIMPDMRARFLTGSTAHVGGHGSNATLRTEGQVTFEAGSSLVLDGAGAGTANLLVASGITTVNVSEIDLDADGLNMITLGQDAILELNVNQIDVGSNVFNSTIQLAAGSEMRVYLPQAWTMAGVLNMAGAVAPSCLDAGDVSITGAVNVSSPSATIAGNVLLDGAAVNVAAGSELLFTGPNEWRNMNVNVAGDIRSDGPTTFTGVTNLTVDQFTITDDWTIAGDTTITATGIDFNDPFMQVDVPPLVDLTLNGNSINSRNKWDLGAGATAEINTPSPWTAEGDILLGGNGATIGGQSFTSKGLLSGNGEVFIELLNPPRRWISDGTVSPGSSPGVIQVNGDFEQTAASELQIELGGLTPETQYDVLSIAGAAMLNGLLSVELIDTGSGLFDPAVGDTFDIVTAAEGFGDTQFATLDLPDLAEGLAWNLLYGAQAVTLEVGLAGDFDYDGDRDGRDFLLWQRGGSPHPFSAADLADWQANYGVAGSLANPQTVPEPSLFVLAGMACVGLMGTRMKTLEKLL